MLDLVSAIEGSAFATWVRESPSLLAYTFILSLHAMGLAVVAGLSVAIDVRLLGVAPRIPLAPARKLFPFMYAGFWVNAASGLSLLAANASGMLANPMFYIKIGFIVAALAVMHVLRGRVFADGELLRTGVAPSGARALAIASLCAWGGAIVAGRLTAYPTLVQGWFGT
jgi:hypothetical protein